MDQAFFFILNSSLLGVGLAMDAFSVSVALGLRQSNAAAKQTGYISGVFALYQFLMPMLGWFCVRQLAVFFSFFRSAIPLLALILLSFIGIKMIKCDNAPSDSVPQKFSHALLWFQGAATSVDALSVGFTIANYDFPMALASSAIIGAVTFCICAVGVLIGKKAGGYLAERAGTLGGIILILVGLEIFLKSLFS